MKKFLCLMLAFVLYLSIIVNVLASENVEENSDVDISSILTHGPLTFDTHNEWLTSGPFNEGCLLCCTFESTYNPYALFGYAIQDVWNDLMPDESRLKLEAQGITQTDYHNLEMARAYLANYATNAGVDPNSIETVKIGDYYYGYIVAPYSFNYCGNMLTYNAPTYYTLMNGYLIKFFLMASENSAYHNSFLDMLSTMSIGVVDSLTGN